VGDHRAAGDDRLAHRAGFGGADDGVMGREQGRNFRGIADDLHLVFGRGQFLQLRVVGDDGHVPFGMREQPIEELGRLASGAL
jgi:hypothetical protein